MKMLVSTVFVSIALNTAVMADEFTNYFFSAMDNNQDGMLDMKEFRGVDIKDIDDDCTQKLLKTTDIKLSKVFEQLDEDKNKKISKSEFTHKGNQLYEEYWKSQFNKADSNNDKHIAYGEFHQEIANQVEKFNAIYSKDKLPKSCQKDLKQWSEYYQGYQQYAGSYFSYLDKNNDSRLSYSEYKGEHLWE